MKKTMLAVLFSSLVLGATAHAAPLTADQEAQVRKLVRDTLVENPEILEEAIVALQAKQGEKQQAQMKQVLKDQHDALFNDPTSPRIGSKDAKLVLVNFTDFNCPYCKRFDPLLEEMVKKNPDVAVVIKYLPFKGNFVGIFAISDDVMARKSKSVLSIAPKTDGETGHAVGFEYQRSATSNR